MKPEHVRHKAATELERPREIVLACPPFKSSVNLSRIVRLAGCAGIPRVIACDSKKIDPKIARDALEFVDVTRRRTLISVLGALRDEGFHLVGLEQTTDSHLIYDYQFVRKTALVIGHERHGMSNDELRIMNDCIEIPVYGRPHSYNVVTATTMAVYEYIRQFPQG